MRFLATPSRWLWSFVQFARRVWVRVTMIAVLSLVAAGAAPLFSGILPERFAARIGAEAVRPILNVLATSMLAVTTFSLSVMVSAHRAAADNATPRAHQLLLADSTTQTVLATFLGAFLYALASIVLIEAQIFDSRSIAVIFAATVLVILLVVLAILRWIEHLSGLGSMLETTRNVENAAEAALAARVRHPWLGGRPAGEAPAELAHEVFPDRTGYVRHIDTGALEALARTKGCAILLTALPGDFAASDTVLARLDADDCGAEVRQAFSVGDVRSFDQDPRFGLVVLSEIASRALSPGINDPGTAIDVIGRVLRLLSRWESPEPAPGGGERQGGLYVPALDPADLLEDGLAPTARDGAGVIEVQLCLQKALATLAATSPEPLAEAARALSARALDIAREALPHEHDVRRLESVLQEGAAPPG